MPPTNLQPPQLRRPEDILASMGLYSPDAYVFIQAGLEFAAERAHGRHRTIKSQPSRHISGQQLCEGLRAIAIERWGLMAQAVLATWGVHRTIDFGKIVFAMIDSGHWQKQPEDRLEDFANVYDFKKAFIADYRIKLAGNHVDKRA